MKFCRLMAIWFLLSIALGPVGAQVPGGKVIEVCDALPHRGRMVRLRGLARIVEGGLLLSDGTCSAVPPNRDNMEFPMEVKLLRPQFSRLTDRQAYIRNQEQFHRRLYQVIASGRLLCKEGFSVTVQEKALVGNGYGRTGLIVCQISDAHIDAMQLYR